MKLAPLKLIFICICMLQAFLLQAQSFTDSAFNTKAQFKVEVKQPFQFGTYAQGSTGGDIIIGPDGSRSVTGTIIPLNFGSVYAPLILEIEAPKGSIISIFSSGNNTLTGSNGGKMLLQLGNTEPASPFYITKEAPEKTYLTVGGILSVGNAANSPAGNYSGNLYISFIVE